MMGTVGAIVIGIGVAVAGTAAAIGIAVSGSAAADAAKYAAEQASAAEKYKADQQRIGQTHEADLLFKTEQADRELDEKYRVQDMEAEKGMMAMFDQLDQDMDSAKIETQRRIDMRGQVDMQTLSGDEYYYPDPVEGEMYFS